MFEVLFKDQPALFIPVVSILGAGSVFIIWILAHYWHASRRQELEAALKQDMLNRGLSVADIERVLLASSSREEPIPPEPQETITDNEYHLVEKMLDDGHSIEDIEKLVKAFQEGKGVATNVRLPRKLEV